MLSRDINRALARYISPLSFGLQSPRSLGLETLTAK
jgi:hypothetical protein